VGSSFFAERRVMIHDIIKRLDEISANKDHKPLDVLGSYIVGATMARDDIEELYAQYPTLETIAELGAELETLAGSIHEVTVFKQFQNSLALLKQSLKNNP